MRLGLASTTMQWLGFWKASFRIGTKLPAMAQSWKMTWLFLMDLKVELP